MCQPSNWINFWYLFFLTLQTSILNLEYPLSGPISMNSIQISFMFSFPLSHTLEIHSHKYSWLLLEWISKLNKFISCAVKILFYLTSRGLLSFKSALGLKAMFAGLWEHQYCLAWQLPQASADNAGLIAPGKGRDCSSSGKSPASSGEVNIIP